MAHTTCSTLKPPLLFAVAWLVFCVAPGHAQNKPASDDKQLPAKAAKILNDYCFRCHRGAGSSAGRYSFNAKRVDTMVDESMIVAGNSEESELARAVSQGRMPPRNQAGLPRPSADEVAILKQWIDSGAQEFPSPQRRPFMSLQTVMKRIAQHNREQTRSRKDIRYFTLANLYNDPGVDDRQLRMTRAALAKAINSLSWQPIVLPQAIDPEQTIFAVDISKLGWGREHWAAIVAEYPYEIDSESLDSNANGSDAASLRQIDADLATLNGNDRMVRHVRADWFISIGLRPKLYHKLLYDLTLPELRNRPDNPKNVNNPKSMTDRDLEKHLGLNVLDNIFGQPVKAARAGFNESGISGQNRSVERHEPPARQAYYWKSYDFLESNPRATLAGFPLGPARGKDQDEFAFNHDGGEFLYSLPNGLQGYLLATGKGDRIDAGPIEIVGDALKTSGNQLIVNGLSCIVCHRQGIIEPPPDEVRGSALVFGEILDRVRDLYPSADRMQALVEKDEKAFTDVAHALIQPYLLQGEDAKADVVQLPEPVGEVAKKYLLEPMNLDTVASELYLSDIPSLRVVLKNDRRPRLMGIGQLIQENGTIKRAAWEGRQGRTLMQQAADVLGYGN